MGHMKYIHSRSTSLFAHATILLWRENPGWELVLFSSLQYILGNSSAICSLKDSTELELIKRSNKEQGGRGKKRNMKRNKYRLVVVLYTWNTTSSTYKLCEH